jgi:hypothetical protein
MVLDLQARYPSPSSGSLTVPFRAIPPLTSTASWVFFFPLFFSSLLFLDAVQLDKWNLWSNPQVFHNLQVELSGAETDS